ncbi:MAG: hypothetical protein PHQ40_03790 [Anaerolineaceae bacterium]|nr:hypothetical protein [Anaerolineaceae bacterium]
MRHYNITLDDQTFDVEVLDDLRQEQVRVSVDGEVFTLKVEAVGEPTTAVTSAVRRPAPAPIQAPTTPPVAPVAVAGAATIKSPLPGVIKSIAVRKGQKVAANDELCVIEAMKAMNVIRAPRPGTIGEIYVTDGKQIPHGSPLMDLI